MLTAVFKPFLIHHLRICKLIKCTPFEWSTVSEHLIDNRKGGPLNRINHKFQLVSSLIYLIGMALKIVFGKDPIAAKCQGVAFFAVACALCLIRWHWGSINRPAQALNTFIKFEKTVMKGISSTPSFEDKAMVLFLKLLESTAFAVPVFVIAIQIPLPCALPFFGSLSPFCVNGVWTPPNCIVRFGMLGTEFWLWAHMTYDGTFYTFYSVFVSIVCILDYLRHFKRLVNDIGKETRENNAIYDHGDTAIETRVSKALQTYRCIQLLEKTLNDALKRQVFPAVIGFAPQIQVFTLFVCIKLYSEIPFPGFAVFPLLLGNMVGTNVMANTLAAGVNSNSISVLSDLNQEMKGFPIRSRFRKELRSCEPLKIQFGQNFVDKGTPLVIQDLCFNQTVSLLLLSKNNKG